MRAGARVMARASRHRGVDTLRGRRAQRTRQQFPGTVRPKKPERGWVVEKDRTTRGGESALERQEAQEGNCS